MHILRSCVTVYFCCLKITSSSRNTIARVIPSSFSRLTTSLMICWSLSVDSVALSIIPPLPLICLGFSTLQNNTALKQITKKRSKSQSFSTLQNNTALKLPGVESRPKLRFSTLQNNTALKHVGRAKLSFLCFSTLQNNTALKQPHL